VLYDLKRYDEALASYLRTLALFPVVAQEVETWNGIQVIYRALNLPMAAQEAEHLTDVARERSNQRFKQGQAAQEQRRTHAEADEARQRAAAADDAPTTE